MTKLSVNLNKIALLRNSRGRDYPNVIDFAKRHIDLGVDGITVHPRQDERHIKIQDTRDLAAFLADIPEVEFNVEGYPSEDFLRLIEETKPDQCTLVPDAVDQLTSDHGWDLGKDGSFVKEVVGRLKQMGVRSSIFIDPDVTQIKRVPATETDRVELYTEEYAAAYHTPDCDDVLDRYATAAKTAQELGIGVNAGHDLDLRNLAKFLTIGDILEVSIGHALTIECIENGMKTVVSGYLGICHG